MNTIAQVTSTLPIEFDSVAMSQAELDQAEATINRGLNTFVEVGQALVDIRDKRGYRLAGCKTFEEYCQTRWAMTRRYANNLISASEVVSNLGTIVPKLPETESQARPLSPLEPEQQREAWGLAVQVAETENNGKVTAAIVEKAVETVTNKPHVSHNSGQVEWYTPEGYIIAARSVLGEIDLDPASSETANKTVKAKKYYTQDDDGLTKKWRGKVWMNPPYSSGLVDQFCEKLVESFRSGDVTEAIVLVNNATETKWFAALVAVASAVVFPTGRVRFVSPNGDSGAPLQGQAVIYLGGKPKSFLQNFSALGWGAAL